MAAIASTNYRLLNQLFNELRLDEREEHQSPLVELHAANVLHEVHPACLRGKERSGRLDASELYMKVLPDTHIKVIGADINWLEIQNQFEATLAIAGRIHGGPIYPASYMREFVGGERGSQLEKLVSELTLLKTMHPLVTSGVLPNDAKALAVALEEVPKAASRFAYG